MKTLKNIRVPLGATLRTPRGTPINHLRANVDNFVEAVEQSHKNIPEKSMFSTC